MDAVKTTCQEELGPNKKEEGDWIKVDTLRKIRERKRKKAALNTCKTRAQKALAQNEYTQAHKVVHQSIKKDKQEFYEDLADQAEEAAHFGNLKALYDIGRKLAGKFNRPGRPVKDKLGQVITES